MLVIFLLIVSLYSAFADNVEVDGLKSLSVYTLFMSQRETFIQSSLQAWGFDQAHLIPAVQASSLNITDLMQQKVLAWKSVPKYQAKWKPRKSEIAVHLSHLKVLKTFVASAQRKDVALIFEDDLTPPTEMNRQQTRQRLESILDEAPEDWHLINLGSCNGSCDQHARVSAHLVSTPQSLCRSAYLVSVAGAQLLLQHSLPMNHMAGDQMWDALARRDTIRRYVAFPLLFKQKRGTITTLNDNHNDFRECGRKNRKHMYVLTLQGVQGSHPSNDNRLDKFKSAWEDVCGEPPNINICEGILHERRGYGNTLAFIECLKMAEKNGHSHPIFFEDDARLKNTRLCKEPTWHSLPEDTFVLMLGGHHWRYVNNDTSATFRKLNHSFGTYGFMVPHENLKLLYDGWNLDVQAGFERVSPDVTWYNHATHSGQHIYSISPTLVWHEGGYSNNLKIERLSIKASSADASSQLWSFCSNEGEICECYGRVRFGNGRRWTPLNHEADIVANGTIPCNRFYFGDPVPHVKKICQCRIEPKPNAFILGVAKCGTTSFADTLRHENIVFPHALENEPLHYKKELHFFTKSENYIKGVEYYNSHYRDKASDTKVIYMDATPAYFVQYSFSISHMIASYGETTFRQLKFIVLIRDPISRLESWWNFFRDLKCPPRTKSNPTPGNRQCPYFKKALVQSGILSPNVTLHQFLSTILHTDDNGDVSMVRYSSILAFGAYSVYLQKWLNAGARPEQFKFIFLHELKHDTKNTLKDTYRFLGVAVPDELQTQLPRRNRHVHTEILSSKHKEMLKTFYAPFNRQLACLLNEKGIRSSNSMRNASSGWLPTSPTECEHACQQPVRFCLSQNEEIKGNASNWKKCADEHQKCSCANGTVRFGIDDCWAPYKKLSSEENTIQCTYRQFGDPVPHVKKICQCTQDPRKKQPVYADVFSQLQTVTNGTFKSLRNISFLREPTFARSWKPTRVQEAEHLRAQRIARAVVEHIKGGDIPSVYNEVVPVKHIVVTNYEGARGQSWIATRNSFAKYADTYGYELHAWQGNLTLDNGTVILGDPRHPKWTKLVALEHATVSDGGWAWWIDADVELRDTGLRLEHITSQALDTHDVILTRRIDVTSSNILVRRSKGGRAFLAAWRERSYMKREHENRFVDQGVLIDMLFEPDTGNEILRPEWRDRVQIHHCLCTDLYLRCRDVWCESLFPTHVDLWNRVEFATHAAGCSPLGKCALGLQKLPQKALPPPKALPNVGSEYIYAVSIVFGSSFEKRVKDAIREFYRQTYTKKILIVVMGHDNLWESWTDDIVVRRGNPGDTIGALREIGQRTIPMGSVWVSFDSDDVRHPRLLEMQYNELMRETPADFVTLGRQILYDVVRNASTIAPMVTPRHWHGIAGTIMVRKTHWAPSYATIARHEDSIFLKSMLITHRGRTWDNPPHYYVRITHGGAHASGRTGRGSLRALVERVNNNTWHIESSMLNYAWHTYRRAYDAAVIYLADEHRFFGMKEIPEQIPFSEIPLNSTACTKQDVGFLHSLTTLYQNFLRIYPYPVIIIHTEEFTEENKRTVFSHTRSLDDSIDIRFVSAGEFARNSPNTNHVPETNCAIATKHNRIRQGYFGMCAFFARDILRLPDFKSLDYYMRLDTDSCINDVVYEDFFKVAYEQNAQYMYRDLFWETDSCWENWRLPVKSYACENVDDLAPGALESISWWSDMNFSDCSNNLQVKTYPRSRVFATNWEVVHLPSFQEPRVARFIDYIYDNGGIWKSRWGDAPLRTITALLFLEQHRIIKYSNWSYFHKVRTYPPTRPDKGTILPTQRRNWCCILSGTVYPHADVDRLYQVDPEERMETYFKSLSQWSNQSQFPFFFVDNSPAHNNLTDFFKSVEAIANKSKRILLHLPVERIRRNKGLGERDSVHMVLEHTSFPSTCEFVIKVTGRYAPDIHKAVAHCSDKTEVIIQGTILKNHLEVQIFGWKRGGTFEQWYMQWGNSKRTRMLELDIWDVVQRIGGFKTSNVLHGMAAARKSMKICVLGALPMNSPVPTGGFNAFKTEL